MSEHVSSADEATASFFEDGGGTFGDSLLEEDEDDALETVAGAVSAARGGEEVAGVDAAGGESGGVVGGGRRVPAVSGSASAASSPIVAPMAPESPPATPIAHTPPESPDRLARQAAPDSPPSSPTAPFLQPGVLDHELLDFEAEPPGGGGGDVTAPVDCSAELSGEGADVELVSNGTAADSPGGGGGRREEEEEDGGVQDSLEEGEVSDDDDKQLMSEPKSVCRFFNKGQCTWGISCRFIHPGVTDKGNYNMFAPAKGASLAKDVTAASGVAPDTSVVGATGATGADCLSGATSSGATLPPAPSSTPDLPRARKSVAAAAAGGEPRVETAWERAMREAKERVRKSSKRRQADADFEDKKMNLGVGHADSDPENDYYTRPASPVVKESAARRPVTELDPYDPHTVHRRAASPRASPPGRYRVGYPPPPPHMPHPHAMHHPAAFHYPMAPSGPGRRVAPPHPMLGPGAPCVPPTEVWGMSGPRGRIAPPHPGLAPYAEVDGRHRGGRRRSPPQPEPRRDWKQERYEEVSRLRRGANSDQYVDPWMRLRSPRSPSRRSYSSGSSRSSRSVSNSSSSSSLSSGSRSRSDMSRSSGRRARHRSPSPPASATRRHSPPVSRARRHSSRSPPPVSHPSSSSRRPPDSAAAGRPRYASHTMGAMLDRGRRRVTDKSSSNQTTTTSGARAPEGGGPKGGSSMAPAATGPSDLCSSLKAGQPRSGGRVAVDPAVRRLAAATAALQRASQESAAARRAGAVPASARHQEGGGQAVAECSRKAAASVAALATRALHESARRSLAAAAAARAAVPAPAAAPRHPPAPRQRSVSSSSSGSGSGSSSSGSSRHSHRHGGQHRAHHSSQQQQRERRPSCSVSSVSSRSGSPHRSPSRAVSRRKAAPLPPAAPLRDRPHRSPDAVGGRSVSSRTCPGRDRPVARATEPAEVPVRRPANTGSANSGSLRAGQSDRKPIDLMAESGRKQQIRLTLRGSSSVQASRHVVDKLGLNDPDQQEQADNSQAVSRQQHHEARDGAARKRPLVAQLNSVPPSKVARPTLPHPQDSAPVQNKSLVVKKSSSSRREELMKQLRAVEEAISKKRTT